MGNFISNQNKQRMMEKDCRIIAQLRERAVSLYQYREKQYNFYIHGSFDQYMRQIAGQFEVDCLPDYVTTSRFE